MDSQLRSEIHDATLAGRTLLMIEAAALLEGVYGLMQRRDGRVELTEQPPELGEHGEAAETRRRLETFLTDERRAGLATDAAYRKLVKEVAFTHLNRLVAFKMLEARRLVRGAIDRGQASNGFKFYLVDHPDDEARSEAPDQMPDLLDETPRDAAYRHFLLWQSAQIAQEIRVLFDADNLASRLFPRPAALGALLDLLNAPALQPAWSPGNEEAIGWVYQYFNEPDLDVFRSQRAPKVPPELVAAKTEQFTPRWIVTFLVQNTLGRFWLQMHPDSSLADEMEYLVPTADTLPSMPTKPVAEITLLDPACGAMHFGLVAFDLFTAMYREELQRAGEAGWPTRASVASEAEIPAAIIANNLFGIDIDLRAVQLAALALYLKAKTANPQVRLRESNLACADVQLINGARLDAFLHDARFSRPVYDRVVRSLWTRLKDSAQLGSLLRLEDEVQELIAEERRRASREASMLPGMGDRQRYADAFAAGDDFWGQLYGQVRQSLEAFVQLQAEQGIDVGFFVGEASKGLKLLDVMARRYDCVCTNPPYLDSRDYNAGLKTFVESAYPEAKRNLYSAFIERSLEFLDEMGRLGIVTPQTFMFISSFERLRSLVRGNVAIEAMAHTGLNTFPDAVVDIALYVLRWEPNTPRREASMGTYFRLVKEPAAEAKRRGFERALARLRAGQPDAAIYHYRQSDFDAIPGSPWVYWITPGLRELFQTLPRLEAIAPPRQGLATADNFRFLRFWWEAGLGRVGRGCLDAGQARASEKHWFPYMKGGGFQRWFGNQEFVVDWRDSGAEIKTLGSEGGRIASRPQNMEFYFRRGVTYSYLTSGTFSARLSPGGFAFDVAGSSLFPDVIPPVLAVLNATFAAYALKLINPTVNFQIGDLARLPIAQSSSPMLERLVAQAIELARQDSREDDSTYDFVTPPAWRTGLTDIAERKAHLAEVERQCDEEVYRLYGIGAADRAAIEAELAAPVPVADEGAEVAAGADVGEDEAVAEESALSLEALAQRWVAYAVGIALGRFVPGEEGALGSGAFASEVAAALRALADDDGIAPLDEGHPDDLARKVERALTLALGGDGVAEVVATLGFDRHRPLAGLRAYLAGPFFKQHAQRYRKRPVYWPLQSPKLGYSVYLFHERLTRDSLYVLQGPRYLGGKINHVRQAAEDLRARGQDAPATEKRRLRQELDDTEKLLHDLQAMAMALKEITEARNDRGEVVGWTPELDDGVILNLVQLLGLLQKGAAADIRKEAIKHGARLEAGDYDWSHTAMRYWPTRVLEKCRTNKSYAIAHGRGDLYAG